MNAFEEASEIGALAVMAELGLPLQVHGEVTDPGVDLFDREAVFLERILAPIVEEHPGLKVDQAGARYPAGVSAKR